MSALLRIKRRQDDASQAVAQTLVDMSPFKMDNKDRLTLGTGPTFKVQIGEDTVINEHVPKRAAMAFSKAFNDSFTAHPHSSVMMLDPDQVSPDPTHALVDWIDGNGKTKKPFPLKKDGLGFADTIDLYRHGLIFGMDRHVAAIRNAITARINDNNAPLIGYEALNEVAKLPIDDRVYQGVVRKLEGLTYIGALDDDEAWPLWLKEHQEFCNAMASWKVTREQRAEEARNDKEAADWERDFPALV